MAVTFVNHTALSDGSPSPYTFGDVSHTTGSGTRRSIVLPVVLRDSGGFMTGVSCTWSGGGGMSLTKRGTSVQFSDATGGQEFNLEIWDLIDPPASTAGTFSFTSSGNATAVLAHALNIQASGPISYGAFGSGFNDSDPGTDDFDANITTPAANSLIIGAAAQVLVSAVANWDQLTEIAESGSGGTAIRLATAYGAQAAAGAANYAGDWGGSTNEWAFALASYHAAASGALLRIMLAHCG